MYKKIVYMCYLAPSDSYMLQKFKETVIHFGSLVGNGCLVWFWIIEIVATKIPMSVVNKIFKPVTTSDSNGVHLALIHI